MARSAENKRLINALISESTGFNRDEENFSICQNYVTSNLRFHRFLDVDSHKVNKTLQGLYEKFTVHSKIYTGDILKQKVALFLSAHEFEKQDVAETDTHYAILSFLLEMANCPTARVYTASVEEVEDEQLFDDFDWAKYLTEDLEPLQTQFSDSSSDSEESVYEAETVKLVPVPVIRDEELVKQVETTTNTLRDLVVSRYWDGEQDLQLLVNTDLAHNWNGHLRGLGALESVQQDLYMTEYQMVREVLWSLSGVTDTFLFAYDPTTAGYSLRDRINLTHTTKTALAEILNKFVEFANEISKIRQFVSKLLKYEYPSLQCRTYQAFCLACSEIISTVDCYSTEITVQIQNEEVSGTLISLLHKFREYRQTISILHSIYLTAIAPHLNTENPSVSSLASLLLTTCNSAVDSASVQPLDHQVLLTVVRVFVRTLEPYLTIIDEWLTDGNLNDPYFEFVIKKKNSECLDETFWDTAVEVTTVQQQDAVDCPTDSFSFNRSVPEVLDGTLTKIAVTGKSMEMLSRLGKLNVALGDHNRSLFCAFIEQFCTKLSWNGHLERKPSSTGEHTDTEISATSGIENTIASLHANTDVHPLLLANLRALFEESKPLYHPADDLRHLLELNACNMMNLGKEMSSSLQLLIEDRSKQVSQCLLQVLKADCKLDHYLSLIQKVYLLEAGDMMYEFIWELCDKIRLSEDWKDLLSLNVSLQECLEKRFPKDASRFTISLVDIKKSEFLPIHILEELHLHYEVDWPFDVVYNRDCEVEYNKIFQFLLQLKLAKHSVDHLKFNALQREPIIVEQGTKPNVHDELLEQDMYLLRMRILHAVNGLHHYIMTTILHFSCIQFEKNLQTASDLEKIIKEHRVYLDQIYNRCFLHKNNVVIHDCILRILNCSLLFQKLWDCGIVGVTRGKFKELSSEFNRCIQILISFISSLTKTGSLPHLESLTLSLRITAADTGLV